MTRVPTVLRERAAELGDRVAVRVDGGASLTFAEWDARSDRLALALVAAGVAPDDRVALRVSNAHACDYVVAYFAIQKAGGVVVPLNTRLTAREAAAIVDHAEPRLLLGEPGSTNVSDDIAARARHRFIVSTADAGVPESWRLPSAGERSASLPDLPDDGLADILYTSGTTGRPKGVASSHRDVAMLARNKAVRMFEGATFLHAFPLFTFAGTHGMTMMGLAGGMTVIVMPRFDADRAATLVQEHRVSLAYLAPAMLRLMLDHDVFGRRDFSSLRLLLYGSAATPPDTVKRLATALPGVLQVNVYGLTEGGAASCSLRPEDALARPGSIGRPNPPAELTIRDDEGHVVPTGARGEIWMRVPGARRRYFRDEAATRATWTEDGWLRTGDVGHFDDAGFLYLDDRKKDVVIRGGHNVFPAEVEAALGEHPDVAESAVVGIPHDVLGEDLVAFVVLRPGGSATASALRAFLLDHVADYKAPRRIELVPELPKNAMGKTLRRELRERAAVAALRGEEEKHE